MKKLVMVFMLIPLWNISMAHTYEPTIDEVLQYKDSVIIAQENIIEIQKIKIEFQDSLINSLSKIGKVDHVDESDLTDSLTVKIIVLCFILFILLFLFFI